MCVSVSVSVSVCAGFRGKEQSYHNRRLILVTSVASGSRGAQSTAL